MTLEATTTTTAAEAHGQTAPLDLKSAKAWNGSVHWEPELAGLEVGKAIVAIPESIF